MGFFTYVCFLIIFLFRDHPNNITNIMTLTSNVLWKQSHFVHVLFEAAVDAVTL